MEVLICLLLLLLWLAFKGPYGPRVRHIKIRMAEPYSLGFPSINWYDAQAGACSRMSGACV